MTRTVAAIDQTESLAWVTASPQSFDPAHVDTGDLGGRLSRVVGQDNRAELPRTGFVEVHHLRVATGMAPDLAKHLDLRERDWQITNFGGLSDRVVRHRGGHALQRR